MKKKLFSLVLALALCLGLTVPVSASLKGNYEIFTVIAGEYTIRGASDPGGGSVLSGHDGVKDKAGNIIIPANYISLDFVDDLDVLIARKHVGDHGYADGIIDIHQNVLVPFQYDSIRIASGDRNSKYLEIADRNTYLRGIMSPEFSVVVPTQYYEVSVLSSEDGYFMVSDTHNSDAASDAGWHLTYMSGCKWGVYNKYGTMIIPCVYDSIRYLGDGYFAVKKDEFTGMLDRQGKVVLPFSYTAINRCKDVFAVYKYATEEYHQRVVAGESMPDLGERWTTAGIVDINNNVLIDFGKYQIITFNEQTNMFSCGNWTGEYVPQKYQIVGAPTVYENKYEYEYIRYDSLNVPGNTTEKPSTSSDGPSLSINTPGGTITIPVPDTKPSEQTPSNSNNSGVFTDVKSNDYYADAVQWAVEKNITSGTSKTTFSPGATCSKAQILTFLWRANGSPELTAANPFTDIKTTDYFYKAAVWAAEKGLVSGSTFGANTDCTRAMTVEYLWKAAGSPTPSTKASFTDVPTNVDYAQAVAWAVENKITSGTGGGNFSPAATCTRGQIVTFLHRAMGK